jgi:TonB family protein
MLWLGMCFFSAAALYGQSAKDAVNDLHDSMANSQLVLKNFSGEDRVLAAWSGAGLELEPPRWRTMGVLTVESIKLKREKLTLKCVRHVAVRDETDKVVLYAQPSTIDIEVNLNGADPAEVLPKLKDALFYPSISDALAAIPKELQNMIPARIDKSLAPANGGFKILKPLCDCVDRDKPACVATHRPMDGMIPPKYLHSQDPRYSDDARNAKLGGLVDVRLRVDANGHPTDLWVARPLGMGLDEEAAKSVLTYAFKPATCHGTPVSVFLAVEVKFQIY